ncbi:MAG: TM0106 family RecB-like putative nuclease [Dehalococcoidia bacterium]|nr:TM0106 family RecB-like putative nuclease [Dehalococcoidia bacterium]
MQLIDGRLVYSATDLVGFLECRHLANLERAAVEGHIKRPMRADRVLDRIAQRGREHEARFLSDLIAGGAAVVEIGPEAGLSFGDRLARGRDATLQAMRSGAAAIYQATLFDGWRLGYADFLRRVDRPSALGGWSYEVWDTKLARHAKASAVLQICMYSEMVGALQGRAPEQMHLALGGARRETVSFRVTDYAAYSRSVARDFEQLLGGAAPTFPVVTKPEPVEHCDVCRWSLECRAQWRAEDDLSLVANLTSRQRRALHGIGVATRTGLAEPPQPLPERLEGAGREALARIQAQARIQVRGERLRRVISERIQPPRDRAGTLAPNTGLLMLPAPSPGDLFFDIEGDPFFGSEEADGIDYLFGVIEPGRLDGAGQPAFHAFWAIEGGTVTPGAERRAFEAFIDLVMDRLAADPQLHIYHYAPYEPTAVRRLAGRHGTREQEVDRLLRGNVFVDLYRAARQSIRASVESYSIKRLEPLYGFKREIDLRDAGTSIVEFETWLELGQGEERSGVLAQIEGYNRDDCVSTLRLRDWLEQQRDALEADLAEQLLRPSGIEPEETEDSEAQQAVQRLVDHLTVGLPEGMAGAGDEQRGRWLLAQLLNWHRREAKAFWWRYFFLKNELTDEERRDEPDALGVLTFERSWPDPTPKARSTLYRFTFPPQEHKIRAGDSPHDPATGGPAGTVFYLDDEAGVIDLRLATSRPAPTATSLIPHDYVAARPKPASLQRLARWVIEHGIDAPGDFRAARDLLMGRPPRAGQERGGGLSRVSEDAQNGARRLLLALDRSYLAVRGPPGSGKSSVGARMIVDLVAAGKRVGVTANSHKVIGELLEKAARAAEQQGVALRIGQRTNGDEPACRDAVLLPTNDAALAALSDGSSRVVGGTAWLWARPEMAGSVDVLFIDEAGQMSLADALAASLCATNLVLLGDPQQLDQPLQGAHPPGSERSALAHVLNGERVIPSELGLFLDGTWRLHPSISAYTSEVFYEGRLHSHPGRDALDLTGAHPLSGTGMRFIPVLHEGHSNDSPEEAAAIAALIRRLLASNPTWTDAEGTVRPLTQAGVLLITPYNAQVTALRRELSDLRIGTVDKFQGQEAPIAVYSMATSSPEEAPRGLEFLYSLNRLNVATSRAQCLAVVVASPALLRVRCRTPRQMRLVNALARLVEVAGGLG